MAKIIKPVLAEKFENLLWANTPVDWIVKGLFINGALHIIVILPQHNSYRMRRKFPIDVLEARKDDLQGLAQDCVHEMRSETDKIPQ